jgi:hypothetical protein
MMNPPNNILPQFKRGAIRPVECISAGWALVKDQYWVFVGMAFVGIVLGSMAPLGLLLGPMMCALHLAFFSASSGGTVRFEDLMKGFDYFAQSLIATLFQVLPMMIIMVPLYLIGAVGFVAQMARAANSHGEPSPADMLPLFLTFGVMFAIVTTLSMLVGMLFIFTYPLIVDKKLSGVEAVKLSVKAALGNFGGVLVLTLLIFLLGLGGALACYVGAFLVLPISFAARHVAYKQVFGDA